MSKEDNLNPGSKEAVEKGCKCPVLDNHHGKGVLNGNFWINKECPIHGEPEKKDVWEKLEDVWFDEVECPHHEGELCDIDHFTPLKSFIKNHFIPRAEVEAKYENCPQCTGLREEFRANLVEKIEKLDAGGGGSGRRLKVQILDLIKTINND